MFISTEFLVSGYGVDEKIARFFVDRDPPADNLYWHGKLLYLRPSPGYLFIPLIVDLLYKIGIDREQLLSAEFVEMMELTGHISALEETGQITKDEAVEKCVRAVTDHYKSEVWYTNLVGYLRGEGGHFFETLTTPFKALHRGDIFLFSVCMLQFREELQVTVAEQWFALISTLLLLDDADDIDADRETGDENAFLESGLTNEGFERIARLEKTSIQKIALVNVAMAKELDEQYQDHVEKRFNLQTFNHS